MTARHKKCEHLLLKLGRGHGTQGEEAQEVFGIRFAAAAATSSAASLSSRSFSVQSRRLLFFLLLDTTSLYLLTSDAELQSFYRRGIGPSRLEPCQACVICCSLWNRAVTALNCKKKRFTFSVSRRIPKCRWRSIGRAHFAEACGVERRHP